MTRILGRVAAGGRAAGWMPALISAWSEERKPELKSDPFLLPSFEPQSTCIPGERGPRTADPWTRWTASSPALAHRFHGRPRAAALRRRCWTPRACTPRGRTRACG